MEYICKICGEKIESNTKTEYGQRGAISQIFKKHLKDVHNISLEQYILRFYFNDEIPKCKCGCGKNLLFREKNSLWDPLNSFGKYINCGHVGRHNEQIRSKIKNSYKSKFDNIEWIKNHYYNEYGQENIEKSAKDFLQNNDLANIDIGTKYGIDIRTLKAIWFKLGLVTQEQWKERCLYRKFNLSGKRRKKKFENKEIICNDLFDIIKNHPFKYNIRSLIEYYNSNNLWQINTDVHIVLEELEKIYDDEIYNYLEFNKHSKEEKEFLKILKFFLGKSHVYRCGFNIQYGKNKTQSYIYDICIDNKYIIEYDGIYYHNESNKEREFEKENYAINLGYKFLRISSNDFKNIDKYKEIINFIKYD